MKLLKNKKFSVPIIALVLIVAVLSTALAAVVYMQISVASSVTVYHSRNLDVLNATTSQPITTLNWDDVLAGTSTPQTRDVKVIVTSANVETVKCLISATAPEGFTLEIQWKYSDDATWTAYELPLWLNKGMGVTQINGYAVLDVKLTLTPISATTDGTFPFSINFASVD